MESASVADTSAVPLENENAPVVNPEAAHRPHRLNRPRRRGAHNHVQANIAEQTSNLIWESENSNKFFLLHGQRPVVAVIPSIPTHRLAEMSPYDLHALWLDISRFHYHHRVRSRQCIVHEKDWRITPHVHVKLTVDHNDFDRMAHVLANMQQTHVA